MKLEFHTLWIAGALALLLPDCAPRATTTQFQADIVVAADGSAEYESITDAVSDAREGDVILVRPGVYKEEVDLGDSPENLTLIGASPATTVIDADGEYAALTLKGGGHRVSGLTVRGGDSHGIYVSSGSHDIDHCLIVGNGDRGVYVSTMSGNPSVRLDHCTIADNKVSGVYTVKDDSRTSITNCIIAFNNRGIVSDQDEKAMTIRYNCVYNEGDNFDRVTPGKGNSERDPQFKNHEAGNYRLSKNSPCIGQASDGSNVGCF